MSDETVYMVGYNVNPFECGLYEWRKTFERQVAMDEVERLKKMPLKKRAKIFECTENQAQYMTIRMLAYVPANRFRKEEIEDIKTENKEE